MTTPLSNIYSVASLTNGSASPNPQLTILSTDDVSSTTVYADIVRIAWQSTDTGVIGLMKQTATGSLGSNPIPGSISLGIPTATSSAFASLPSSSTPLGGLSSSAKVGIGIGVPIAIIAVVALAAYLYFSRRRRRSEEPWHDISVQETQNNQPQEFNSEYREPSGPTERNPEYRGLSGPTELDTRAMSELPGTEATSELDGRTPSSSSIVGGFFSSRKRVAQKLESRFWINGVSVAGLYKIIYARTNTALIRLKIRERIFH